MDETNFLTTEEVLDYLHLNVRTLYRLIKTRQIPAIRVGRQWRFQKDDLDAWVRRGGNERRGRRTRATPRRVLVVDDDQTVRDLLVSGLKAAAYEVDAAGDGPAAIARLHDERYDLLITDLKMPGMDGLTVIREARRQRAALPIIIVTGNSTEASAIEAINLGVSGYVTKPFRIPRIVAAAARALGDALPAPA